MFDRGEAAAGLDHLGDEFELKSAECEKWEIREKALGVELEVPLRHFLDLQTQLDRLKSDLKTAKKLERELGEATDRFALRQIHEECERRFNTGSPREVIKRTGRAIESLERNTDKLERRLRQIARRGSLDIAKLVIDRSNLCYEEGKLIGLYALRAVCAPVPDDIDLIVFFDSSIRKKLGVSDDKLRSQLPGVSMHVVASGAGADESILHAAQAPGSFVLSNDRFADFPEKSAVNEGRIIRHEIVNGCVRIEDLSIEVKYDDRGRLRAP